MLLSHTFAIRVEWRFTLNLHKLLPTHKTMMSLVAQWSYPTTANHTSCRPTNKGQNLLSCRPYTAMQMLAESVLATAQDCSCTHMPCEQTCMWCYRECEVGRMPFSSHSCPHDAPAFHRPFSALSHGPCPSCLGLTHSNENQLNASTSAREEAQAGCSAGPCVIHPGVTMQSRSAG